MKTVRMTSKTATIDIETCAGLLYEGEHYSKHMNSGLSNITLLIYEKYKMRLGAMLAITILSIENSESGTTIEITAAGGGVGLMAIDYGAEASAIRPLVELLAEKGFTEQ